MQTVTFENTEYTISFEAMPDSLKDALTEKELEIYINLLQRVQLEPRKVYAEVKEFCNQYRQIPEILNLLTFAHIQNFRVPEAEKLIQQTYLDHPDYFFARINYADQCIRKKQLERIEEIFPSFNLQELYPGKTLYHTSEFRGFLVMMSYYHLALKNKEKATHYYRAAHEIEPNNPNVVYLGKRINKRSLLSRLFGKSDSN